VTDYTRLMHENLIEAPMWRTKTSSGNDGRSMLARLFAGNPAGRVGGLRRNPMLICRQRSRATTESRERNADTRLS
jgi:hypothetical protein